MSAQTRFSKNLRDADFFFRAPKLFFSAKKKVAFRKKKYPYVNHCSTGFRLEINLKYCADSENKGSWY